MPNATNDWGHYVRNDRFLIPVYPGLDMKLSTSSAQHQPSRPSVTILLSRSARFSMRHRLRPLDALIVLIGAYCLFVDSPGALPRSGRPDPSPQDASCEVYEIVYAASSCNMLDAQGVSSCSVPMSFRDLRFKGRICCSLDVTRPQLRFCSSVFCCTLSGVKDESSGGVSRGYNPHTRTHPEL
jgi:hypothetical protein